MKTDFDALLVVSFGGPEGMDDVIPFLENVLRGRNVPRERMLSVARHYELFGGVSPINQQNRELIAALEKELEQHGPRLPIYWGNRNWHPLLPDTLRQMAADGIKNALAFVTSAYSSYSSCRQYLQNISDAQAAVGPEAPRVEKLRVFYNHPLFIEANVDHIRVALSQLEDPQLLFTAHSIPETMAVNCDYASQLAHTGALIAREVQVKKWHMVYQSRSGSPMQPWLGPDVSEHLRMLRDEGVTEIVIAPIGFVSDHMEVVYDLDVEARQVADEIGMKMVRAQTAGTHPSFVRMIRELIMEKVNGEVPVNICAPDCCRIS
ncbi:MAG TPA: ferrochelatase [Pyrinomonadaceae bacterium]|nr:ferrochelatase [Pyrinomonadaceae bacterium]